METRLQSNEVRIPKPEFDMKNSSFGSDTLDGSQTGGSHYFKSSFARSLSTPQSKSLDFSINCGYGQPTRLNYSIEEVPMEESPFSMPPITFTSDTEDGCCTELPPESIAISSSVNTAVKNIWTDNAQVCGTTFKDCLLTLVQTICTIDDFIRITECRLRSFNVSLPFLFTPLLLYCFLYNSRRLCRW